MSVAAAPPAPPSGPSGALRPTVHRLRLCPTPEDPAVLVSVGAADLPPGLVDQIGRLAESGSRCAGPVLTYSRLPDGGGVLCRLTLAAALLCEAPCLDVRVAVLPEGAARAGLAPIDAWPEDCWPTNGELEPYAWIDRAELIDFAAEVRGQLASVLADVRDLFAKPAGPQILLVERRPHDVARWIALICASLPRSVAGELTFTTSAARPYAAYEQIVGISPEADFSFSEAELRHLYRVRSHEGRCSPASTDPWAEIAARLWQLGRPELINADTRIPLTEPFDAGRLAAVALLEDLPAGREAELLAADWLSRPSNTRRMTQRDVDGLMDALTRIDRAALGPPEPRPAPAVVHRVLRAFHALRRRATPEAAAPVALRFGRAALRVALDRGAEVSVDPLAGLGLGRTSRQRLADEFGAEVLALLSAPGGSPARLAGALILATALGLDVPDALVPSASRLTEALLAACAGNDRRTVTALLGCIVERGAIAGVLVQLETTALAGRVFAVATFARLAEGGAWLAHHGVRSYPALRIVLAATDPRRSHEGGFELFRDLWQGADSPGNAGELAVLTALCWPRWQELLPVREAIALGNLLPPDLLRLGGFDGQIRAVFERCVREHREIAELAAIIVNKEIEISERSSGVAHLLVDKPRRAE